MRIEGTYFIASARDQMGIESFLMMIEETYDDGTSELIVMPTYHRFEAYRFMSKEEATEATRSWLLPNLTWTILEGKLNDKS